MQPPARPCAEGYGQQGTDLDEALTHLRSAQSMRVLDAARGPVLGELGRALLTRCEADDTYADLDEAISLLAQAIAITPRNSDDWVGWHINLATEVHLRAGRRTMLHSFRSRFVLQG